MAPPRYEWNNVLKGLVFCKNDKVEMQGTKQPS